MSSYMIQLIHNAVILKTKDEPSSRAVPVSTLGADQYAPSGLVVLLWELWLLNVPAKLVCCLSLPLNLLPSRRNQSFSSQTFLGKGEKGMHPV